MKKALTIGGAVLGVLLAAALVIFIFFPGLPTYLKVKHKFDHIDERVPVFKPVSADADLGSFTLNGVKLKAPADWEPNTTGHGLRSSSDKSSLMVIKNDYQSYEKALGDLEALGSEYDLDPWSGYQCTEEDYRHFYSTIGIEPPQYGLNLRMLWYMRDDVTAKDCLRLRGKDRKVFLEVAESKEESVKIENMWKIKGSGFLAYVGQIMYPGFDGNTWTVNIFPDGNENEHYTVTVKCSDEALTKQIISSIELE